MNASEFNRKNKALREDIKRLEDCRPTFILNEKTSANVMDGSDLAISGEDFRSVTLKPPQAIAFAHWIIATYGETVEAADHE